MNQDQKSLVIVQRLYNHIYILREDLLPFSFGGNKYRIAMEYFKDLHEKKKNCIISYGSRTSNLNRILAALSSSENMPCYLVIKKDSDNGSFNEAISLMTDATIVYADEDIASTIEHTIELCKDNGYDPYYIYGDKYGKGNETTPLKAYIDVYKTIQQNCFDYVFLPVGTGMTISSLLIGKEINNGNQVIVGISVSRDSKKERAIINNYLTIYDKKYNGLDYQLIDDYLFGGYGMYGSEIDNTIVEMYMKYGIPLDPIYTGKAFHGMLDYIKKNKLEDKKILFIHTGGTPLFFDYLNKRTQVLDLYDFEELKEFLRNVDKCFSPPLSSKADLGEYAKKLLSNGKVFVIRSNHKIASCIGFYANDTQNKKSFVSLLGTLPEFRGKGYASKLLNTAERYSRQNNMKWIEISTEKDNISAQGLYLKQGFKEILSDNKIYMEKEL